MEIENWYLKISEVVSHEGGVAAKAVCVATAAPPPSLVLARSEGSGI